jgi:hypothetical protein
MSAALRLVEPAGTPTMSPASLATPRSSMSPTLVPRARISQRPVNAEPLGTIPPMTQRSATFHPRGSGATQLEAYNLLAVMRLNVDFLQSLLGGAAPPVALEALEDLHRMIDRLEHRCVAALPFGASRGRVSADP